MQIDDVNWSLSDLRLVLNLRESGTISAAAARAGMTQSAVSQKLKRLESALGIRCWERRGRVGGILTALGDRFADYAADVLARTNRLASDLTVPVPRLELRVAASTIPGELLLPGWLADYRRIRPDVAVRVRITDSREVVRMVEAAEVDAGFSGLDGTSPGAVNRSVGRDKIVFAVRSRSEFGFPKQPIAIDRLSAILILMREPGSGTRAVVETAMKRRRLAFSPHARILELGSTQAVVQAIRSGIGGGFISSRAAAGMDILAIRSLTPIWRTLYLVFNEADARTPPLEEFVAYISVCASKQRPGSV